MPTLRFEGSLAAGASDGNILANSKFVQLPFPASVSVYATQTGADVGDLSIDWTLGSSIEIDGAAVPTEAAGIGPYTNRHLLGSGVAAAFDRQTIKLTNADAVNAALYRVLVVIRRIA